MNCYIDTEFIEGKQEFGTKVNTIDLISIAIVREDGSELYLVSKEFNLKEAWFRFQLSETGDKIYWLRENVLKPIFIEKFTIENRKRESLGVDLMIGFTYSNMKYLLDVYAKPNKYIAEDVYDFCITYDKDKSTEENNPTFYGYYADYDWVVFCWLFGKMIDLPKGFPYYCRDLKQTLDECFEFRSDYKSPEYHPNYPKQTNEHNALADARWNKQLHEFLNKM